MSAENPKKWRPLKILVDVAVIICLLSVAGAAYLGHEQQTWAWEQLADINDPDGFHYFYYHRNVWQHTSWLGVRTLKLPLDLMVLQEILFEKKPDVIIEAGTHHGGSALYMATLLDAMDHGKVITIDIKEFSNQAVHDRINYILGSSTAPETVERVKSMIPEGETVMAVLSAL